MNALSYDVANKIGLTPVQYAMTCGYKLWTIYGRARLDRNSNGNDHSRGQDHRRAHLLHFDGSAPDHSVAGMRDRGLFVTVLQVLGIAALVIGTALLAAYGIVSFYQATTM